MEAGAGLGGCTSGYVSQTVKVADVRTYGLRYSDILMKLVECLFLNAAKCRVSGQTPNNWSCDFSGSHNASVKTRRLLGLPDPADEDNTSCSKVVKF
jgi:hypothetical protein